MQIRAATANDAEIIARLNKSIQKVHREIAPELFIATRHEDVIAGFKDALAEEGARGLIAWEGENPVGYCLVKIVKQAPTAWTRGYQQLLVDQLSVEPRWQLRGVGTLLMKFAYAFACENGIREVIVNYWSGNEVARAFYRALGFAPRTEKVVRMLPDAGPPS
jgi:diamine N-acetyltransferase